MKDDGYVCTVCEKKEVDGSSFLTCMYCFSSTHFKCRNIVGNAVHRMKEKDYFCTPDCSSIYLRIVSMQNNKTSMLTTFAAEMKSAISISVAREMQSLTAEVKQIIATIEKSQEFLSAKFDEIVTDFKDIKLENEKLKAEVTYLKNSQSQLKSTVYNLEANVDKSDKAALENNVVVWGIPTIPDVNAYQLVSKLMSCLGMTEHLGLVSSAERMFPSNKSSTAMVPIRIVFSNKESKEEMLCRKKQFGKLLSTSIDAKLIVNGRAMSVTLRDELTPLSLEILKDLRESQETLNIKYVWVGRGGVILAKKDDISKPELVKSREDLSRVTGQFAKMERGSKSMARSRSPKQN